MSRISDAISELHKLDMEADKPGWLQGIHPLPKLFVTVLFLVITVSFGKYELSGLLKLGIYLIVLFVLGDISVKLLLKRMKVVLALVCLMGIVNPFFDRREMLLLGGFAVTGGMLSAATLMLKGVYAVSASYLLIVTTSVEEICYALRRLHVPKLIVTVLMLVYRYIIVLLKETAVAGYVGLTDLTRGVNIIRGVTYQSFLPLMAAAVIYLIMVIFFTWLVGRLERRLRESDRR